MDQWVKSNLMSSNKAKRQTLHLGCTNPTQQYGHGAVAESVGGEGPGGVGWQLNTGLKLCQERFKLVIRKSASVDRVVRGCDGLRQAAVLSPPLQVLERWWMWH